MVIVMKQNATDSQIERVIEKLVAQGFDVHRSTGVERTILGTMSWWTALRRSTASLSLISWLHEPFALREPSSRSRM